MRDNWKCGHKYGAEDNLQMRDNWKCSHKYSAEDNLQVRKNANAVPRTAVGGRYRGNRNPTPTKTYKRHPWTIVVSMDMIKRTERTVKSRKKEQKKEQKKNRKEVQKEEAERYVSKYSSH